MRRLGLVARFAILSALLIGVLGVVLARSIETGIRKRNLESARQSAVLVSRLGVQPRLTPGRLAKGLAPSEIIDLNHALHAGFLGRDVSRIKIWNRDLRVVYSDDCEPDRKPVPQQRRAREALGGETESEISDLARRRSAAGSAATPGKFLEVYTPIRFAADQPWPARSRSTCPTSRSRPGIRDDVRHLWMLLIAGLALLWPALFRIVLGAARRLRTQMERNEHQASHDPLTELANRARFDQQTTIAVRDAEHVGRARRGAADGPRPVQGRQRLARPRLR